MLKNKIEALTDEVYDFLSDCRYEVSRYGIRENLDRWAQNKQALYDLLKQAPNWNEEQLAVVFSEDYDRPNNPDALYDFVLYYMHPLIITKSRNKSIPAKYINDDGNNTISALYDFLYKLRFVKGTTIPDELYELAKANFSEWHIGRGLKITRAINKIAVALGLTSEEGWARRFASFCDDITPLKITRFTTLSIHPIDFLRMSSGNSWTSCHRVDDIDDIGCYSAGTLSYMNDAVTMIFSTISPDAVADALRYEPKITRQCFHFEGATLLQARLYPQCNDGNIELYEQPRHAVENIIAGALNAPNLWTKHDGADYFREGDGSHAYPDFRYLNDKARKAYVLKGFEPQRLTVGTYAYDVDSGDELQDSERITQQANKYYCERCGRYCDVDDMVYIEGCGYYCTDCAHYCDYCNEWTVEDVYYVDGYGDVCDECLSNHFYCCENCGDYVHEDAVYFHHYDAYCEACYSDIMSEEGEEDEE